MTRGTKREYGYIDLDYCDLEECISHLHNAFNAVPEDCRHTARFYVDYGEEYGSTYARQQIQYDRPETDDEMNKRIAQQAEWNARRIAQAKQLLGITE